MEITHKTYNLRIAPRKLRLVADQVRHQSALDALGLLPLVTRKGAGLLYKSLKSAVQVAEDKDLDKNTLTIQRIFCDEGMKMKRSIGHSRGRASMIMKQSSHLSIILKGEPRKATRRKQVTEEVAAEEN